MSLSGAACGVACATFAGSGTPLISRPIEQEADGWNLRLESMAEGYDSPPIGAGPLTGGTIYTPQDGQRFLHVLLKIRNESSSPRPFLYDACDVDMEGGFVRPGVVTSYNGVVRAVGPTESYGAGEENSRRLIFSYPNGKYPTRLRCDGVTIAFPPLGGR
jgi:hypothetical protein